MAANRQPFMQPGMRMDQASEVRYGRDIMTAMQGMQLHSTPVNNPAKGYSFTDANFDLGKPESFNFMGSPVGKAPFPGQSPLQTRIQDLHVTAGQDLTRPPIRSEYGVGLENQDMSGSFSKGTGYKSIYEKVFSGEGHPRRRYHGQRYRNKMAARECIRMEERARYAELLQQFTTTPVMGKSYNPSTAQKLIMDSTKTKCDETLLGTEVIDIGPEQLSDRSQSSVSSRAEKVQVQVKQVQSKNRENTDDPLLSVPYIIPKSSACTFTGYKERTSWEPVTVDLTESGENSNQTTSSADASSRGRASPPNLRSTPPPRKNFGKRLQESRFIKDDWLNNMGQTRALHSNVRYTSLPKRNLGKCHLESKFTRDDLLNNKGQTRANVRYTSPPKRNIGKCLQESRFIKDDMLNNIVSRISLESKQVKSKAEEEEIKIKYYKDKRKHWDEDLEKRIHLRLQLSERIPHVFEETFEKKEKEEEAEEFPELTDKQEEMIDAALVPYPPNQKIAEGFRLELTRDDIQTLVGRNWLNDEVINFYMNLLMERSKQDGYPKVHAFNTFFYPKIIKSGQQSVRRWTKKVDIFSMDYLLVPVHLGMHWCLAVVDFRKKEIRYYDSLGGSNTSCLEALRQYLIDESMEKKKQKFDMSGWKLINEKNIPQQLNGSDCGMFACKFAEYITRDSPITFGQEHMPYFRRRMVYEILTKKLM